MSAESSELLFDIADEKLLTIGTVVERLRTEFPDVSVSKLRYLEEQHLIAPQRTKSGYRLFSQDDYRRLVRVLAMQRDEYLPLKVIRRELERNAGTVPSASRQGLRKADLVPSDDERQFTAEEVQSLTGADASLLSELEEYELVKGRQLSGVRRYSEIDAGIIGAAQQLAQAGLRPKNLRIVKSAVDREVGLVEGVLLPALRANRPERRREALDEVEHILQATTQLRQLLLAKNIRRLTAGHTVD
ncbi:MAG: MerR family transcriptional regulator [Thermoleophilia bacterium]|jgi:DNA-binding transcriptional MerR regulator